MKIDDKTKDEKLHHIDRTKISALLSGKIDEYEYLTGEQTLTFDKKNSDRTSLKC